MVNLFLNKKFCKQFVFSLGPEGVVARAGVATNTDCKNFKLNSLKDRSAIQYTIPLTNQTIFSDFLIYLVLFTLQ